MLGLSRDQETKFGSVCLREMKNNLASINNFCCEKFESKSRRQRWSRKAFGQQIGLIITEINPDLGNLVWCWQCRSGCDIDWSIDHERQLLLHRTDRNVVLNRVVRRTINVWHDGRWYKRWIQIRHLMIKHSLIQFSLVKLTRSRTLFNFEKANLVCVFLFNSLTIKNFCLHFLLSPLFSSCSVSSRVCDVHDFCMFFDS